MRVFQPTMIAIAPNTSVVMTSGRSAPGTPAEAIYAAVPAEAPILFRPEMRKIAARNTRPRSSATFPIADARSLSEDKPLPVLPEVLLIADSIWSKRNVRLGGC